MLNGIHLVDYGNHRDTRLTFGRMTALVGQNGAGKTTVMKAIQAIQPALSRAENCWIEKLQVRRGVEHAMITASRREEGQRQPSDFGVRISVHDEFEAYRHLWSGSPAQPWLPNPKALAHFHDPEKAETAPKDRWGCRYFKSNGATLQRAAMVDPNQTSLYDDGSNLAWALVSLMTEHPTRFQAIVHSLKEVVPIVKGIRARSVSVAKIETQTIKINNQREHSFDEKRSVPGQELLFDMLSGDGLPAGMVSEGTLAALGVLTLVHGMSEADLIMIDDVELGLHPRAQRDLIRQLHQMQKVQPKLQIILSTHSPYVVDELKPSDVWVFAPDMLGNAAAHRLDEHPDAERALGVFTTGEFWSAEGEKWVLDEESSLRVAETP